MNTPKAILIGFAMVAAAVYFSKDVSPAQATEHQVGKYNISDVAQVKVSMPVAWVIDNKTVYGKKFYGKHVFSIPKKKQLRDERLSSIPEDRLEIGPLSIQ